MKVQIDKAKIALADFLDNQVLPAFKEDNAFVKWTLGGLSALAVERLNNIIHTYRPILITLGVLDDKDCLCIDMIEKFLNSAFRNQQTMKAPLGIPLIFNKEDGDYLLEALRKVGE